MAWFLRNIDLQFHENMAVIVRDKRIQFVDCSEGQPIVGRVLQLHLFELDDKYIVVRGRLYKDVHFICIKTLDIERTLVVEWEHIAYERGLLFILNKQVIRTWNVASGGYLNQLHIPPGYAPYGEPAARIKAQFDSLVVLFEDYFGCQHLLLCWLF